MIDYREVIEQKIRAGGKGNRQGRADARRTDDDGRWEDGKDFPGWPEANRGRKGNKNMNIGKIIAVTNSNENKHSMGEAESGGNVHREADEVRVPAAGEVETVVVEPQPREFGQREVAAGGVHGQ